MGYTMRYTHATVPIVVDMQMRLVHAQRQWFVGASALVRAASFLCHICHATRRAPWHTVVFVFAPHAKTH